MRDIMASRNVLVICVTVMFCFVLGTSIAVIRLATDGPTALGIVTVLFTNLGITIAALAAVIKSSSAQATIESVKEDTDKLANGHLEATMAKVLSNWLRDENARPHS